MEKIKEINKDVDLENLNKLKDIKSKKTFNTNDLDFINSIKQKITKEFEVKEGLNRKVFGDGLAKDIGIIDLYDFIFIKLKNIESRNDLKNIGFSDNQINYFFDGENKKSNKEIFNIFSKSIISKKEKKDWFGFSDGIGNLFRDKQNALLSIFIKKFKNIENKINKNESENFSNEYYKEELLDGDEIPNDYINKEDDGKWTRYTEENESDKNNKNVA